MYAVIGTQASMVNNTRNRNNIIQACNFNLVFNAQDMGTQKVLLILETYARCPLFQIAIL